VIRTAIRCAADRVIEERSLGECAVIDEGSEALIGSPDLVPSIISSIKNCDVVVADFTFTTTNTADKPSPNPNVMMEYGYALREKGEGAIITVFNEAYGPISQLPFDVRNRRTIPFNLPPGANVTERDYVTKQLAQSIYSTIRLINAPFLIPALIDGGACFVPPEQKFTIRAPDGRAEQVFFPRGPKAFIRLQPKVDVPPLARADALKAATRIVAELPMPGITDGLEIGADDWGACSYASMQRGALAWVSQVTLTRELWATELVLMGSVQEFNGESLPIIPSEELDEVILATAATFISVAEKQLCLEPPLTLIVGVANVEGLHVRHDIMYGFSKALAGPIQRQHIVVLTTIQSLKDDIFEATRAFWAAVYDAAPNRGKVLDW
jgi:hypothetical protein